MPDQFGLERIMKTCTEADDLSTLSLGAVHDLVNNKIIDIPDNINLLDIFPKVVAPTVDSPESCFLLPKPESPDPEYILKPSNGSNPITDLEISSELQLSNNQKFLSNQGTVYNSILPPKGTPEPPLTAATLLSSSESNNVDKIEMNSGNIKICKEPPPSLEGPKLC